MDKTALVFGSTGQDGSYLCELLVDQGYDKVVAVKRRSSTDTTGRLAGVKNDVVFAEADLTDPSSINALISYHKPDEIYNLAAQSHVGTSFEQPAFTFQANAVGVLNILEGIRTILPSAKFYQASTSEMFGDNFSTEMTSLVETSEGEYGTAKCYQDENTTFAPRSPYAVAKMAAHNLVHTYRESYGIHASCGILFNHESERRGENFVTRKITKYVAGLVLKAHHQLGSGLCSYTTVSAQDTQPLALGNLEARRDWGHAEDYVRAMWLMLQQEKGDDYVVAMGETRSVRDFLDSAFRYVGIVDWEPYVVIDPRFYRPSDVEFLLGRPHKAMVELGWTPEVTFDQLVERMLLNDLQVSKETQAA
tara:strand:- start:5084 stop:6172 length:1089 start_codon:yes stop_codon:yes gene_type:complete